MLSVMQKYKIISSGIINMRYVSMSGIHSPVESNTSMTTGSIKPFKEIPGPSSLPLIGSLHHFLPGGTLYNMTRPQLFRALLRQYGPIVRLDKLTIQPDSVFLYDAESIGTVLRSEETSPRRTLVETLEMYRQTCSKQVLKERSWRDVLDTRPEDGHLNWPKPGRQHRLNITTGDEWQNFRSPANKAMINPKVIRTSYSKIIDDIAKEAVESVIIIRNKKGMIRNLSDEISLWAMESTVAVTIGQRLNCINRELAEDSREKLLISLISTILGYIETIDFGYNIFHKINFGQKNNVLKAYSDLESTLFQFINKSMASWESREDKVITNSVHACTVEKIYYKNKNAALGVALDSTIAGIHAITQSFNFLLYHLGSNPEKQQMLREEILYEQNQKQYLRACMKESSRILPTAVANTRVATKSHEIMGYQIPEKTVIVIPQEIMSTMESHYPRATEFIPERWLVEKGHPLYYGNAHPFSYLPFGFGTRTCLGRRMVELIIEIFTVNMIKKFEVTWEGPPPKVTIKTFNKMEEPNRFIFKDFQ